MASATLSAALVVPQVGVAVGRRPWRGKWGGREGREGQARGVVGEGGTGECRCETLVAPKMRGHSMGGVGKGGQRSQ